MKNIFPLFISVMLMASCVSNPQESWTEDEQALINVEGQVMRVLTVDNPADSTLLRTPSLDFSTEMLESPEYRRLADKMVATVTSPEQDGVGIAGPQVGILRRVVAVMRYDKEDKPFEVFPNIRITALNGEKQLGGEGCLSVPGRRGEVARYQDIEIAYTNPATLRDTTEHITGFTAVIFQHECDHLDGIIYTDRIE